MATGNIVLPILAAAAAILLLAGPADAKAKKIAGCADPAHVRVGGQCCPVDAKTGQAICAPATTWGGFGLAVGIDDPRNPYAKPLHPGGCTKVFGQC